jgi:hypothetical protein
VWKAFLPSLLTASIAVFEPGTALSWAAGQRSVEDDLQLADDISSRHNFTPRPPIHRWQALCSGADHREVPTQVLSSHLPVLAVGDSTIVTRGSSNKRSELGDWKQNRHWAIEVSAHEGKGYASLARAIRLGDHSRALVVYWMLNDCVYTSKSSQGWVWFDQSDMERRAATIACEMKSYPRAIGICGATG